MAKYVINDATLAGIANAIREKAGSAEPIRTNEMAEKIRGINVGLDTSDADATANDIAQGKTAYVDGQKVTGNIGIIDQTQWLYDAPPTWWDGDNGGVAIQFYAQNGRLIFEQDAGVVQVINRTKFGDATDADVAEGKTYTSENGLKRTGTKQAPVPVTQATPTITVDDFGLITAKSTQGAGLVSAGTKQATKQLDTLEAQVITPGTDNQIIYPGVYLKGAQLVMGDANLIAENIKNGISIFGVTGTFAGGGLPDGVSAIASGTVTPAEGSTSGVIVTHNLGVVPNFCVWFVENDYSASTGTNIAIAGAIINKSSKYTGTSSIKYNIHYLIDGYSNSQQSTTSGRASNTTYLTTTQARLVCNSTYPIQAGGRIRWVVGVASGVL